MVTLNRIKLAEKCHESLLKKQKRAIAIGSDDVNKLQKLDREVKAASDNVKRLSAEFEAIKAAHCPKKLEQIESPTKFGIVLGFMVLVTAIWALFSLELRAALIGPEGGIGMLVLWLFVLLFMVGAADMPFKFCRNRYLRHKGDHEAEFEYLRAKTYGITDWAEDH